MQPLWNLFFIPASCDGWGGEAGGQAVPSAASWAWENEVGRMQGNGPCAFKVGEGTGALGIRMRPSKADALTQGFPPGGTQPGFPGGETRARSLLCRLQHYVNSHSPYIRRGRDGCNTKTDVWARDGDLLRPVPES